MIEVLNVVQDVRGRLISCQNQAGPIKISKIGRNMKYLFANDND
jgi:catabolite regulation protein CreA